MESLLPMVVTSGWASGVNAYATVLLLGLLGKYAGLDGVPEGLQRTDVLIAAAVMFLLEFVADKVPWLDSAWDAVHTVIRPTVGAAIGLLASGDAASLESALLAATGGVTALASHAVKSGVRLAVNTSARAGLEHRGQPARGLLDRRGDRAAAGGAVGGGGRRCRAADLRRDPGRAADVTHPGGEGPAPGPAR